MANRNRIIEIALAAALVVGAAGVVVAQPAPPAAIKARQDAMKSFGGGTGAISNALKAEDTNWEAVRATANRINDNFKGLHANFPAGSGPAEGVTTRAKAEIWSQPDAFKAALDPAVAAADALAKAAQGTDKADIQAKVTALQGACGGCHRAFRS